MSAHIAHELPRLLTGEASRDEVLTAAAHLRGCIDCQHELVSAVVAHASLTSAQRFAPEIVSGILADPFGSHGDAEADDDDTNEAVDPVEGGRPRPDLPDLSAIFAQARHEVSGARHARPPSRITTRHLVAAAAAVVLVGGGAATAYFVTAGSDGSSGSNLAGHRIELSAFDKGTKSAVATIADHELHIDAASLPSTVGKRYEVWLTNDQRTKMQPVGWIGSDGTAALTVPGDLLEHYTDIEVSEQQINSPDYAYSGTSVLRGGYA